MAPANPGSEGKEAEGRQLLDTLEKLHPLVLVGVTFVWQLILTAIGVHVDVSNANTYEVPTDMSLILQPSLKLAI